MRALKLLILTTDVEKGVCFFWAFVDCFRCYNCFDFVLIAFDALFCLCVSPVFGASIQNIDVCLKHAVEHHVSTNGDHLIPNSQNEEKNRTRSVPNHILHRFPQPNAHCDGTGDWSVFNNILRSFVQQYINYCKAIPLTYECICDDDEQKNPRKILRSTVITVTDNRHELFARRKDVHRKRQPNKIERNGGEEA